MRRSDVVDFSTWMLREAPSYGVRISVDKWHAYSPRHPSEDPAGLPPALRTLEMMGCSSSTEGLPRLLGAPIGSPAFCTKPGGQLDSVVRSAASFISQIKQLGHATAEYQMLRWCASVQLHHLPRLMSPAVITGYASLHRDAIFEGLRSVLNVETFTDYQRAQITLPEYEGGLSLVTSYEIMLPAYIGCSGAVARFFRNCNWPEAKPLYQILKVKPALVAAVEELNDIFDKNKRRVSVLAMDTDLPHAWPQQSKLSKAWHRVRADELESQLALKDATLASWFASCRLKAAGAWLHALSRNPCFRVSGSLYRVMLCLRLLVRVSGAEILHRCVCGASGSALTMGVHWFSQCKLASFRSARHDALVKVLAEMCARVRMQVREGESACWIRNRKDLRPFDFLVKSDSDWSTPWQGYDVGVADATRIGLVPTGQRYFKSGKASSRIVGKKKNNFRYLVSHYGLSKPAEFSALGFEVSGGMGWHASQWFAEISSKAIELGAWGSKDGNFASYYSQLISFTIFKLTAMGVMNGIRRSLADSHSSVLS
jgi:hypothetical protein